MLHTLNFRAWSHAWVLFFAFLPFFPISGIAQTWSVGAGKPNDKILVYVAAPNGTVGNWNTEFGTDVDNTDPKGRNELWALVPGNPSPVKLFPRTVHVNLGLATANSSVGEPKSDLYGKGVSFHSFHDITLRHNQSNIFATAGADGFHINLEPLEQDPFFNPDNLTITRLTYPELDKNKFALNKVQADKTSNPYFKVRNLGFLQIRDQFGDAYVFVSDRRHVLNSNHGGLYNQFNLYKGRQDSSGKLVDIEQLHYFTTTAVLSPSRASDGGFYFSYQASTEQVRSWSIWHSSTDDRWTPVSGYSHVLSAHFSTECRTSSPLGNVILFNIYYPTNNNGYGSILGLQASKRGVEALYQASLSGFMISQNATQYNYTTGDVKWDQDDPALPHDVAHNQRWGKFGPVSCGGVDEVYMTWSHNAYSNNRNGYSGNFAPYRSKIVLRNDAVTPASPQFPNNFTTVVEDTSIAYAAIYPEPIMSFEERFGTAPPTESVVNGTKLGEPTAILGSSALWNTQNLPGECHTGQTAFDPTSYGGTPQGTLFSTVAYLNVVRDRTKMSEICGDANTRGIPLLPEDVGAVEIRLTSNKTDSYTLGVIGGRTESVKVLGNIEPEADGSFWAKVPSNAPMDMVLRDKKTGMVSLDRRTWMAFDRGEVAIECGGCHNHQENAAVPFEGTAASQPSYQATDILTKTKTLEYDESCNPSYVEQNVTSVLPPAWEDVFPQVVQYCGGCHATGTTTGLNTFVIDPTDADGTLNNLTHDVREIEESYYFIHWINEPLGALASPFWMAAWSKAGEGRPDGRSNDDIPTPYFKVNDTHDHSLNPGLCNSNDPAKAQFVKNLGLVIDNHLPRRSHHTVVGEGYEFDRYHPSVAFALPDTQNCAAGDSLNVGVWDDSGSLRSVILRKNDVQVAVLSNVTNGQYTMTGLGILNSEDRVEVEAVDSTFNRQAYALNVDQLVFQCQFGSDHTLSGNSGRGPGPNPSDSPTPSPTPGPGDDDDDDDEGDSGGGGSSGGPGNGGSLSISARGYTPGAQVKFELSGASPSSEDCKLVGASSSGQTQFGSATLALSNDSVLQKTMGSRLFDCEVDSSGRSVITLIIPPTKKVVGRRFVPSILLMNAGAELAVSSTNELVVDDVSEQKIDRSKTKIRNRILRFKEKIAEANSSGNKSKAVKIKKKLGDLRGALKRGKIAFSNP